MYVFIDLGDFTSILSTTKQHIHNKLFNKGGHIIQVMVVYRKNRKIEKVELWKKLCWIREQRGTIKEPYKLAPTSRQNTVFFEKATSVRQAKNSLLNLTSETGEAYVIIDEVKLKCMEYYTNLYTQPQIHSSYRLWFPRLVTQSMNIWMARISFTKEIKGVIDKLSANKALGPYGFTTRIFLV